MWPRSNLHSRPEISGDPYNITCTGGRRDPPALRRATPSTDASFSGATLIATPLVIVLLGPILPPGKGAEQASGQVTDNTVLLAMATPVLLLVVLYLIYAVIYFRQPKSGVLEGPAVGGDARVQTTWIVVTSALVLSLAVYGSVRLLADNGAGSGSGPTPLTVPKGPKLPVQVIAQQWAFTYRYPSLGGIESAHLVLPTHIALDTAMESARGGDALGTTKRGIGVAY